MENDLAALEDEAMRLFGSIPFVSGHAGPTLELSPYEQPQSQHFAWKTALRHPAIDFCDPFADSVGVSQDGLRTVSWLTFLGRGLAKELGGAKALGRKLTKACAVRELITGLAVKAGPRPVLGSTKPLTDYEAVFRACEPAIQRMFRRRSPMQVWIAPVENSANLIRRLPYEVED